MWWNKWNPIFGWIWLSSIQRHFTVNKTRTRKLRTTPTARRLLTLSSLTVNLQNKIVRFSIFFWNNISTICAYSTAISQNTSLPTRKQILCRRWLNNSAISRAISKSISSQTNTAPTSSGAFVFQDFSTVQSTKEAFFRLNSFKMAYLLSLMIYLNTSQFSMKTTSYAQAYPICRSRICIVTWSAPLQCALRTPNDRLILCLFNK